MKCFFNSLRSAELYVRQLYIVCARMRLVTCKTFGLKSLIYNCLAFSYMLAICSLCKNYIVMAIREQQTVTVSALPEIILTPAGEDTPDVSFQTITMIRRGSLRCRPNLTPDSNNPGVRYITSTTQAMVGAWGEGGVFLCISYMYCCDEYRFA